MGVTNGPQAIKSTSIPVPVPLGPVVCEILNDKGPDWLTCKKYHDGLGWVVKQE